MLDNTDHDEVLGPGKLLAKGESSPEVAAAPPSPDAAAVQHAERHKDVAAA